jgi:hypothetical protein
LSAARAAGVASVAASASAAMRVPVRTAMFMRSPS